MFQLLITFDTIMQFYRLLSAKEDILTARRFELSKIVVLDRLVFFFFFQWFLVNLSFPSFF